MAAKLTELGAADDTELVSAAQAVLALLNNTGKYNVTVHDSKGVQLGDHDIQVNRFERSPAAAWVLTLPARLLGAAWAAWRVGNHREVLISIVYLLVHCLPGSLARCIRKAMAISTIGSG